MSEPRYAYCPHGDRRFEVQDLVAGLKVAVCETREQAATMVQVLLHGQRMVDVTVAGPGPWHVEYEEDGDCCVSMVRPDGRRTGISLPWRRNEREAIAVCAALNAVASK